MQSLWQWKSIIFIGNILVGVTIIISINICNHNLKNCGKFYYVATSFAHKLRSSSGHDTRTLIYMETKYGMLVISPFYIKNAFKMYERLHG
jgi:hypothetical protein